MRKAYFIEFDEKMKLHTGSPLELSLSALSYIKSVTGAKTLDRESVQNIIYEWGVCKETFDEICELVVDIEPHRKLAVMLQGQCGDLKKRIKELEKREKIDEEIGQILFKKRNDLQAKLDIATGALKVITTGLCPTTARKALDEIEGKDNCKESETVLSDDTVPSLKKIEKLPEFVPENFQEAMTNYNRKVINEIIDRLNEIKP